MSNDNRKHRLSVAYVNCKNLMKESGANKSAAARIDDIMLASIRTLDFIWDTNADRTLDYLLDQIILQMAQVAAKELNQDRDKIYIDLIVEKH